MSFILDALRKSEHERQRSAVPGLAQVPLAAPEPKMPRWAVAVIGVLAAAVLALGGAWWRSARPPADSAAARATIERSVELPPPASSAPPPVATAPAPAQPSLANAAAATVAPEDSAAQPAASFAPRQLELPADAAALPSATALAAEGVVLPPLRLELHAFSQAARDRFVYINGRKYVEGERLVEGPQIVSIEPTGAVLAHAGRRFLLVQE